ncbi:MAG: sigma-54 interaction domain-containing protein, partial [Desulfatiglandales bacterium]
RAKGPFIKVNCAAIPQELLESELFGYEPGAFTGASSKGKPGKFDLAHGGTIFLDEIGDMPLSTQVKLLRVIQEKEVERLGGTKPKKVDFRVIAATNKDLSEAMKKGSFRSDLFFRLKIFHITTPPLREIVEDIPKIAYSLLSDLIKRVGKPPKRISKGVMHVFQRYPWPGNVRELKNVLERAIYVAEGEEIGLEDLPKEMQTFMELQRPKETNAALREAVAIAEKASIEEALKKAKGNKALAARFLGIHRTALYQKLKRHGIWGHPKGTA